MKFQENLSIWSPTVNADDEAISVSLSCFVKEPQMGNMRYKLEKYFKTNFSSIR
jgi:hypothetical protein